jgi:pyrroline-5-carboxylate reductase
MTYELVVIGGGNMGAALLGGLLESGAVAGSGVAVVEPYAPRRAELESMFDRRCWR